MISLAMIALAMSAHARTARRLRRPRRAFTLIEVIVAIAVTALALSTAGFAIGAARSTAARVADHTRRTEADGRLRSLLSDMLRHAPSAEQVDGALLRIDRDAAVPVLRFISSGVREPFGSETLWNVELTLIDSVLALRAEPRSSGSVDQPLVATLYPVYGFDVRALEHSGGIDAARWRTDWPLAQDRPRAIELAWQVSGTPEIAPLRVLLAPLEAPR